MPYAFLSFANEDNILLFNGWVKNFRDDLDNLVRANLARRGERPTIVWFDRGVHHDAPVDKQLQDEVKGAQAMLCLVSGHYLASSYCELEWKAFIGPHEEVPPRRVVFRVDLQSLPEEFEVRLPAGLRKQYASRFVDEIGRHRLGRATYDVDGNTAEYYRKLQALAVDIANHLRPAGPLAGARIWLAPTSPGVNDLQHRLFGDLFSSGADVRRGHPNAPESDMEQARIVVFLFGEDSLDEVLKPLLDRARTLAKQYSVPIVGWVPRDLAGPLPTWIEELRLDPDPIEFLSMSRSNLVDYLKELAGNIPKEAPGSGPVDLLVITHRSVDEGSIGRLDEALDSASIRREQITLATAGKELADLRRLVATTAERARDTLAVVSDTRAAPSTAIVLNQWLAGVKSQPARRLLWATDPEASPTLHVPAPWATLSGGSGAFSDLIAALGGV